MVVRPSVDRRAGVLMWSEQEKMLSGELYDPLDPQLSAERRRVRLLVIALNDTRDDQQEERACPIRELIPPAGEGVLTRLDTQR
jgi:maltose O-acetyltransferase